MRFYAVSTDAVELTYRALQKLDRERKGSHRPSAPRPALRAPTPTPWLPRPSLTALPCRCRARPWSPQAPLPNPQ